VPPGAATNRLSSAAGRGHVIWDRINKRVLAAEVPKRGTRRSSRPGTQDHWPGTQTPPASAFRPWAPASGSCSPAIPSRLGCAPERSCISHRSASWTGSPSSGSMSCRHRVKASGAGRGWGNREVGKRNWETRRRKEIRGREALGRARELQLTFT
jgi:hypothetical protein